MKYVDKTTEGGKIVKLKNYKKRAKRNRIKRKILLVFLILITIIIILLYAPFMKVKKINCIGNEKISTEEIISTSKICIGNNIFRINKSKAIDCIDDISYIKNVIIDRKLPSTVNINIEECIVRAYIINNKEYVFIDENAKILEISATPPETQASVIKGTKLINPSVNEIAQFKNTNQYESLTAILSTTVNSKFNGIVTAIDITDVKNAKITINNKLDIILGDTDNMDYKINFMASGAYDSLGNARSGTLDVSYGSSAIFKEKNN